MRRTLLIIAAASLSLGGAGATSAAEAASHEFAAYPAPVYAGPVAQPAFAGPQRPYAAYRTRIRQSVANGLAFGGRYALAVIGCGTGCRFGYIADLKTGLVYDLPHGGEDYYLLLYRGRPRSRLLQAQWQPIDKQDTPEACVLEDFVWTGKAFRSLGARKAAACPAWDEAG